MDILVVYFSKTGNTKSVAEKIANKLDADLDRIIAKDDKKDNPEIDFKKDPSQYKLVIIGTPVWAFRAAPHILKYLSENKFRQVAFFCTYALGGAFTFSSMKKRSRKPVATLKLHMTKIEDDASIDRFCRQLK